MIFTGGAMLVLALLAGAQPAHLTIAPNNGTNITVQWNTPGALQFASSLNGTWSPVAATDIQYQATSIMPVTGGAEFLRVVDNGLAGAAVPVLPSAVAAPLALEGAAVTLISPGVLGLNSPNNTRLEMAFVPGQIASSNTLTLLVGSQLTTLNDQGIPPDLHANDGVFSGFVTLGAQDITTMNTAISNLPPSARLTEIFDQQRNLVGTNALQFFPTNFLQGIRIPIFTNNNPTPLCAGSPHAYQWQKTVMITDLSVVEDLTRTWDNGSGGKGTKMGAWTFGKLMTDMANTPVTGIDPSDFVLNWLRSWQFNQTINSDPVAAVAAVQSQVVTPWLNASAANGLPAGKLDLTIAPFRLLAIVNRIDLHGNTFYGSALNPTADPTVLGGEGRFVFGVTDMSGGQMLFTVILEYGIPKNTCPDLHAWAAQWAALDSIPFGPSYNAALQAITDQFATANANPAHLPNKSAINQVRANEVLGSMWTLREFRLSEAGADAGWLEESVVKQTPAFSLNNTATLASFITGNELLLCGQNMTIPLTFIGSPFLGGSAPMPTSAFFWDAPSLPTADNCGRHGLSLNACNGCHAGETANFAFAHVSPRNQGSVAALSGFLLGETVPDPKLGSPTYKYADLDRRVQELNRLVICPCVFEPVFQPLNMTH